MLAEFCLHLGLGGELRSVARYCATYLWLQIMAEWLLSAVFLAGLTGFRTTEKRSKS